MKMTCNLSEPPSLEAPIAAPNPLSERLGPVYEDSPNRPIRRRAWIAAAIVTGWTILALAGVAALFAGFMFGT